MGEGMLFVARALELANTRGGVTDARVDVARGRPLLASSKSPSRHTLRRWSARASVTRQPSSI